MKALKFFLLSALLVASGCATQEKYQQILNTWSGQSESSLVSTWGVPSSVYEANGLKYLTYRRGSTGYLPGTPGTAQTTFVGNTAYTSFYGGTSGMVLNFNCETTFIISEGVVAKWTYQGNACVSK